MKAYDYYFLIWYSDSYTTSSSRANARVTRLVVYDAIRQAQANGQGEKQGTWPDAQSQSPGWHGEARARAGSHLTRRCGSRRNPPSPVTALVAEQPSAGLSSFSLAAWIRWSTDARGRMRKKNQQGANSTNGSSGGGAGAISAVDGRPSRCHGLPCRTGAESAAARSADAVAVRVDLGACRGK